VSDLDRMLTDMPAGDLAAMRRVARAYIDQTGDLPEGVWYQLGFIQRDQGAAWGELEAMRPAGAPAYRYDRI
jgi:hypothetical protein